MVEPGDKVFLTAQELLPVTAARKAREAGLLLAMVVVMAVMGAGLLVILEVVMPV
jgi:hypothetical protein